MNVNRPHILSSIGGNEAVWSQVLWARFSCPTRQSPTFCRRPSIRRRSCCSTHPKGLKTQLLHQWMATRMDVVVWAALVKMLMFWYIMTVNPENVPHMWISVLLTLTACYAKHKFHFSLDECYCVSQRAFHIQIYQAYTREIQWFCYTKEKDMKILYTYGKLKLIKL